MRQTIPVSWWNQVRPVIGMLHAPPLPGSPRYAGDWTGVVQSVLGDCEALIAGGVHGLMLENFGDAPFYPDRVPPETIAGLTRLAVEVRKRTDLPLGINVLRNDGVAAIAIALASGAEFVRINVLCGTRVADQGLLKGQAHRVLRARRHVGAGHIHVLADVDVKHSAPLSKRPLDDEIRETLSRGGADGVIISGAATGDLPELQQLQTAFNAAGTAPVIAGSGVTCESLPALWPFADAFIVGSTFEESGIAGGRVQLERVQQLLGVHAELLQSMPR
jgi:membrane complex biogenesis BtpA family protein